MSSVWRKKPISAFHAEAGKSELKRILTKWGLTSLGIGAIIGGGIFTLTGIAAHDHAGPALALSFVIAGVGCLFASLCYAEFASVLPVEGSAYAYAYGTVGELFAWFIGWSLILEYMMGATTVAVAWSGYFSKLLHMFGLHIPDWLNNDPFTYGSFAFNLPAFLITWLVTGILIKGIKEAASTNNLIVVLKVAVVLFVIIAGAFYVNPENWTPFIPAEQPILDAAGNPTGDVNFGFGGVLTAATIVFFAYIGFDAVSTQAGEAINPKRDVPFAIIASLVICTILYILVSLVLTGMVPYSTLDLKAPVASAFSGAGISWAVYPITIAAVAGLTSVMLVMMLGQTRIFFGMAKDGLLPRGIFGTLHSKFKTPYKSTLLVGLIVSIVAAVTPINNISEMCSMGTLLAFSMVCLAVLILRKREPNLDRPYKTPMVNIIAPLGVLFNIFLMTQVRIHTWYAFIIWGTLGVLVYFAYSKRNSNLEKK
ncbi:MAG: APC family permease [Flavobacteriales bacterium]